MTNYTIKQRFDSLSTPIAVFNEKYDDINFSFCIAEQDGQIGMVMANGDVILPFVYDNIALIGNDAYLLTKGGKQGFLRVKTDIVDEVSTFEILLQTECVYDYISGLSRIRKSFIALRKDEPQGFEYQIYFADTNQIGAECCKIDYMDEDYVVVTDLDYKTKKCFNRLGDILFTVPNHGECAIIVFEPFETKEGTVFVMLQSDDRYELIYTERRKKEEFKNRMGVHSHYYEWTGNTKHLLVDEFMHPILASKRYCTFDRDCALAFVVKNAGNVYLLNGRCEYAEHETFQSLQVITHVKGYTDDELQVHIILADEKI